MAPAGRTLLIIGLLVAVYGIGASIYGARRQRGEWVASGRRAVYALALVMTVAWVILEAAFWRSDFSFNVVAAHSSTTTPAFYKLAAPWSSQEGSLLLWVWLLSLWSSLILFLTRKRAKEIAPYATAVLMGFAVFFLAITFFLSTSNGQLGGPFATTASAPREGAGLDPLLLHLPMVIHPPMLYSGYTLLAIPFAFGIGALITGRLSTEWIAVTRRFALAAWLFLGTGIVLGALWSYTELGWGGYWAWDPVENAALMPWLATTAFIHSAMIQEKRGMLKVWNVSLVLTSGTLAILGTFLVRSGILDSIHAFGASTLGVPFVLLLAAMIISGITLIARRREQLRSEARLESLLSREAVFLFQNLVLMAMVFVIFWITFFPLISEAVTGTKVSVGPPAFRPFIVPLALVLVALSGIGPLIAWRRVTAGNLRRNFALPVTGALVTCLVLVTTGWGLGHVFALIMFTVGSFVLFAVAQEVWRGTGARRAMNREAPPVALVQLIRRNRRRYGGYIAHAGLAVLLIGVAASSSFQHSRDAVMRPGQTTRVDGYRVTYVRPTASVMPRRVTFGAVLDISKGGKHVTTLQTGRGFYPSQDPTLGPIGRFFNGEADSDVGLQLGATRDIWTVINPDLAPLNGLISQGNKVFAAPITDYIRRTGQLPPDNSPIWTLRNQAIKEIANRFVTHPWPISFRLIVEPLVIWIWIGAIIVVLGGLLALWPVPRLARRRRVVTRPVPGAAVPGHTSSPPAPVTAARELV